jgi:hypothetical protein
VWFVWSKSGRMLLGFKYGQHQPHYSLRAHTSRIAVLIVLAGIQKRNIGDLDLQHVVHGLPDVSRVVPAAILTWKF